jgi:RNA polymerase sigma-70 factor (ECF subfamily)
MTEVSCVHPAAARQTPAARLAELIALSARGYEDAFAELYDLTAARIHGVVLRVLRSADHAAEVTRKSSWKFGGGSTRKGYAGAWRR